MNDQRKFSGLAYFILTFAWSWLFWIPTALLGLDDHHLITQVGFGLGGLGPPFSGPISLTKTTEKMNFGITCAGYGIGGTSIFFGGLWPFSPSPA